MCNVHTSDRTWTLMSKEAQSPFESLTGAMVSFLEYGKNDELRRRKTVHDVKGRIFKGMSFTKKCALNS